MDTNENVKKKGFPKVLILFVILIVIALIIRFAYARYITKLNGQAEAQIANWTFKVNGSTNDTFEIDLANTRAGITQEANVETGYIAPGTAGAFTINIDASNSEASLTYDLIINSSNIPKNLVFYSDSNFENVLFYADSKIEFGDYINYNDNNKTKSKTFYWKWPYESGILQEEIVENDEDDSQWMGDEISLSINVIGKQVNAEPNYIVKTAEPGDYVNYVDGNGDTILCRVLYNDSTNGLQIVTDDVVKENNTDRLIYLGKNDSCNKVEGNMSSYKRAQNSYSRAILTLNEYAMEYLNYNISYDARCIGSLPTNKNKENGLFVGSYSYSEQYINNLYKNTDLNYENDLEQLDELGIKNINKSYWLASRSVDERSNVTYFDFRYINKNNGLNQYYLYYISPSGAIGATEGDIPKYCFRPVFYINANVKIISGDGTENSPYVLGK